MNRIIAIALLATLLVVSGCNTFSGIGRDLKKAGDWVEEKAEKAK